MTPTVEMLRERWREAAATPPAGREWRGSALPGGGSLRLRAVLREPDGQVALLVEIPLAQAPSLRVRIQGEGISVADQRRPDEGVARIAVVLERDEHREVFEVLCLDIAVVAGTVADPGGAMRAVVRRLEAWQACLRHRRNRLSLEESVGLFGELEMLRRAGEAVGYPTAVMAWFGPLDGLHDFSRNGVAIEVKSVLGSAQVFRVSGAEQLEPGGLSGLAIARVRLRETTEGETLAGLAIRLRDRIAEHAPAALAEFEDRLLRAGHVDRHPEDGPRLLVDEVYGYSVTDGFPRLAAALLPAGILDLRYAVDERVARPFRFEAPAFLQLFLAMSDGLHDR